MTITATQLPIPLYLGTAVTVGVTFSSPVAGESPNDWPPVDPTTVTLTYVAGPGANPITLTYDPDLGPITKVSTGVYICELATTAVGPWGVKWTGTGACPAVWVGGFLVSPTPF